MINRNPLRYIDRHRAKMRLIRKRELDKIDRKTKNIKVFLKKKASWSVTSFWRGGKLPRHWEALLNILTLNWEVIMFKKKEDRTEELSALVKALKKEKSKLKGEVEDLKLKMKIEDEDIKHMVKMKEKGLIFSFKRKKWKWQRNSRRK